MPRFRVSAKKGRSGRPLTIYFSTEQCDQLEAIAKQRHVAKSTLIRFALDRLVEQLRGGQLELPLGFGGEN